MAGVNLKTNIRAFYEIEIESVADSVQESASQIAFAVVSYVI